MESLHSRSSNLQSTVLAGWEAVRKILFSSAMHFDNNALAIIESSGQGAWQALIAYEACVRLCLRAWASGCMEAPEFLHNECIVLHNAFG